MIAACGNTQMNRGYVFDKELADAISPGIDNRASVQSTLGSPTVAGTFSDDIWYYIATRVRVRPVFWPDAKSHRVLAVKFSDAGVVEAVDNYTLADMRRVNPINDQTPTLGRDLNFFEQIFMNVGRFSGSAPVGSQGGGGTGPNG